MGSSDFLPYGRHDISEADIEEVCRVLRSDWLTTGPEVEILERSVSDLTKAPHVVAVSSGTAALHAAYRALDCEPGDEIITPPLTFFATQAAAMHCGLRIVMADVNPATGTLDPYEAAQAISNRTRAIVAVDYAGQPADLVSLRAVADSHRVLLIEDASHSLGATSELGPVGSVADITTFSFFPTKNIATGEGGAVAFRDAELAHRARTFARQGLIRNREAFVLTDEGPWHQEVQEIGLNYRLPDILAALGTSQLRKLSAFTRRRDQIKKAYDRELQHLAGVRLPSQKQYGSPAWHFYPLRVPRDSRRSLFEFMRASGIGVQVNYLPAHLQPALADMGWERGDFPNAEAWYDEEISLPVHTQMTDEDVIRVVETIRKFGETAGYLGAPEH